MGLETKNRKSNQRKEAGKKRKPGENRARSVERKTDANSV
jgi:hypothetical protein